VTGPGRSEPAPRNVALVALVVAVLALALAGLALYRAGQYRDELRHLGDVLGSPEAKGLRLEPLPRPPEPDPDPR